MMINLQLNTRTASVFQVLCLGAHSDDIEIGCGGTLMRVINANPNITITWIVLGSSGVRTEEAQESACQFLEAAKDKVIIIKSFRDGFFPYIGGEIKAYFEQLKQDLSPDLIFTHYRNDLHQDHRLVNELTWNTFRDNFILEYEIPKYDGDLGAPNFFVPLDERTTTRKVEHILAHFNTQKEKHWFTPDTFFSLMRLRGIESASQYKYAEAFYCRKAIILI